MSITFPTFIDKEIPSPEKFNAFVQALEAKFTAGLGSAEIQWPLVAGGNLIMGGYEITGGKKIWKTVNAEQYDSMALALVAGASGCILIPPNTTITMDGEAIAGSSLTIIGSGPSSVLQLASDASAGWLMRNTAAGASIVIKNLTLDGNDIATSDGLHLRGVSGCTIENVWFKDFPGSALKITDLSGTASDHVKVVNNHFADGASHHIEIDDATDVVVSGNQFHAFTGTAVNAVAADVDADLKHIKIVDNMFDSGTASAVNVRGAGAFNTKWAHVDVSDNQIDNISASSGTALTLGASSAQLQYVKCNDNICPGAYSNGLSVDAQYGAIKGNVLRDAGNDAIDLLTSEDLVVGGNNCRDAAGIGVKFDDSVDCTIRNNEATGSNTEINAGSSTSYHYGNGQLTPEVPPINAFYAPASTTLTIPANTLRVGDVVQIRGIKLSGAADGNGYLRFDGQSIAYADVGAANNAHFRSTVIVTDSTSIYYMSNGIGEDSGESATTWAGTKTGLDFTAANTLTFFGLTGSGDASLWARIEHAEIQ